MRPAGVTVCQFFIAQKVKCLDRPKGNEIAESLEKEVFFTIKYK